MAVAELYWIRSLYDHKVRLVSADPALKRQTVAALVADPDTPREGWGATWFQLCPDVCVSKSKGHGSFLGLQGSVMSKNISLKMGHNLSCHSISG